VFHSDRSKFCSDLNWPESRDLSERALKTLDRFGDFQAEYEGSIPFTRSNVFRHFPNCGFPFGQEGRRSFGQMSAFCSGGTAL